MTDKPGDGDLDVDAAWAEIVAHWDAEDLRVVTDDDAADDAADDATDGEGGGPARAGAGGDEPMGWTGIDLDDWSDGPATAPPAGGASAVPPAAPPAAPSSAQPPSRAVPPVPGEARPVGRSPRYDEVDDGPGLGWDAIRSHVGGEDVRSAARGPGADGGRDHDRDDPALAALDEHFVPADPPSLRPTDPVSGLAWLGALGGPLFLLVAALVWREAPSVLIGAAVLAFVAGFVTLVVRMPDERQDEDDGAVV